MGALATDNFNRANETPLSGGGNWTAAASPDSTWNLSSNTAVPSSTGLDCVVHYTNGSWPNDQYSKADLTINSVNGGDSGVGLTVRGATGARTYYRAVTDHAATNTYISKMVAGSYTNLSSVASSWTDGATWQLSVQGTSLDFLRNGSSITSTTDSSIASGYPGLVLSSSVVSASVDNWEGGDFSSLTTEYVAPIYLEQPGIMIGRRYV